LEEPEGEEFDKEEFDVELENDELLLSLLSPEESENPEEESSDVGTVGAVFPDLANNSLGSPYR
jgi:hypothetical protein